MSKLTFLSTIITSCDDDQVRQALLDICRKRPDWVQAHALELLGAAVSRRAPKDRYRLVLKTLPATDPEFQRAAAFVRSQDLAMDAIAAKELATREPVSDAFRSALLSLYGEEALVDVTHWSWMATVFLPSLGFVSSNRSAARRYVFSQVGERLHAAESPVLQQLARDAAKVTGDAQTRVNNVAALLRQFRASTTVEYPVVDALIASLAPFEA